MDYFKEVSNLKPRKESLSSQESTSPTNSFNNSLLKIEEEEEFIPPKLKSERKISVEQKIPEKYMEIFPISDENNIERKESEERKSITQKIKEFLEPKLKEKKEENFQLALDEKRTIEEIITSKGFKCETHYVTTEDG